MEVVVTMEMFTTPLFFNYTYTVTPYNRFSLDFPFTGQAAFVLENYYKSVLVLISSSVLSGPLWRTRHTGNIS